MTGWWDSLADLYVNCCQLLSFVYSHRCSSSSVSQRGVGRLHGKLVGRQDRGGQGMNERGEILQRKGNDNNDRPHTEEVVVADMTTRAKIFPAHECALIKGVRTYEDGSGLTCGRGHSASE